MLDWPLAALFISCVHSDGLRLIDLSVTVSHDRVFKASPVACCIRSGRGGNPCFWTPAGIRLFVRHVLESVDQAVAILSRAAFEAVFRVIDVSDQCGGSRWW